MQRRTNDPRVVGYPQRLNWYDIPPPYELTMFEFEVWALDRLAVLKALETAQVRNIKLEADVKRNQMKLILMFRLYATDNRYPSSLDAQLCARQHHRRDATDHSRRTKKKITPATLS